MVGVAELNTPCKNVIFKSLLNDLRYSFRSSIKKLTGATTDVKLNKIRETPIHIDGNVIVGRIRNLIGGKIVCAIDKMLVDFLDNESDCKSLDYTSSEIFAIDFFDNFSSTSKSKYFNMNTENIEVHNGWRYDLSYYIRFDTKIFTLSGKVIPSNFIISIDEITLMYLL